jgi:putative hydrolase of the HAD superfamily
VASHIELNPSRTLFIDDTESILDAAMKFGIHYCLGVINPDSRQKNKTFQRHPALNDYQILRLNAP